MHHWTLAQPASVLIRESVIQAATISPLVSRKLSESAAWTTFVESSSLGALSPDPGVFTALAAKIGEQPERCVFVDDLAAKPGRRPERGDGGPPIDVRDPDETLRRLGERLGG